MRRVVMLAGLLVVCADSVSAQMREPIGPFVVDVRGVSGSLPSAEGWTPMLPPGTEVPSRGLGFDAGGHVYLGGQRAVTFGVGASLSVAQGSSPGTETTPAVKTRVTSLTPQLSLNFGHHLGWSYLSAGYGGVKVTSESTALAGVPAATMDPGWSGAINFGGGARWFLTDHIGVGFDARWHRLSAREATAVPVPQPLTALAAPRKTTFNLAFGISIQ